MIRQLLFLILVFCLAGCNAQKGDVAGTDTGNPVIQAAILDSNGVALSNATIILYSRQDTSENASLRRTQINSIAGTPIDTLYTDVSGKVSFQTDGLANLGIEVYWNNSLGIYESIAVEECKGTLELTAKPLVDFPTESDLVLSNTGRRLMAGTTTKVPPGLWEIRYIQFGSEDTLPPLQVRIEDAANLPEALQSLNLAASELVKIGVEPLGYVEFADYPTEPAIISKIEYSCSIDGYPDVSECKNGKACHIWQWNSNWIAGSDNVSVLAGALTLNGEIRCVLFPDQAISGRPVFYSFSEVRRHP